MVIYYETNHDFISALISSFDQITESDAVCWKCGVVSELYTRASTTFVNEDETFGIAPLNHPRTTQWQQDRDEQELGDCLRSLCET